MHAPNTHRQEPLAPGGRVDKMRAMMRLPTLLRCCLFAAVAAFGIAQAAELTLQEAIAKVQRETKGKVLGAETVHAGNQTIYRIKVLTRDGQVRVIQVPADSG